MTNVTFETIRDQPEESAINSWTDIPYYPNVVRLRSGLQNDCDIVMLLSNPRVTRKYLGLLACKLYKIKHSRASVLLLDGHRPLLRYMRPLWIGNPNSRKPTYVIRPKTVDFDPLSHASKKLDSGTLVAPTPAERSASSRDVPGSGYANHLAATANAAIASTAPFLSGLSTNNPKSGRLAPFCGGSTDQGVADAKSWLELTRMGEELCRSGTGDLTLIGSSLRSKDSFTNGSFSRTRPNDSNGRRFLGNKNGPTSGSNNQNGNNNNNYSQTNGTKSFNETSWNTVHDRLDDPDSGWTRGLVGPTTRRHSSAAKNAALGGVGGSALASNLPPRMLRKMASQAAGLVVGNGFSDNTAPLVNQSTIDRLSVEDRRPGSAWSDGLKSEGSNRLGQDEMTHVTPDIFQVSVILKDLYLYF
ncbi:unnamed protein product [Echinostoma caproni]|uniref:Uncharacterized protein n=1 Tax=Echinostoma caproni TaxID=27848 RepID=A0A183ATD3_9TREM|nr:unnamed protein product [Echinostoma caproni]